MTQERPEGFDADGLREQLLSVFDRVAREPRGEYRFNRGRRFAARLLNYAEADLALVPPASATRFTGVGNPHRLGRIRAGETVLDHACGSGTDLIIAAHKTGPEGRVIGVDISKAMLGHAWEGSQLAGVDGWTSLQQAFNNEMPVDDESIDVVISNGALNLAFDKRQLFAEILRVLKPGGRLHLSAVVVSEALPASLRKDPHMWANGIGGALLEDELLALAQDAGFVGTGFTERFDCFRDCGLEYLLPAGLCAGAVNLQARKPRQGS